MLPMRAKKVRLAKRADECEIKISVSEMRAVKMSGVSPR